MMCSLGMSSLFLYLFLSLFVCFKASTPQTQRKRHRFRPGTVALKEIRRFQKTWNLLIPAASFIRVVSSLSLSNITPSCYVQGHQICLLLLWLQKSSLLRIVVGICLLFFSLNFHLIVVPLKFSIQQKIRIQVFLLGAS